LTVGKTTVGGSALVTVKVSKLGESQSGSPVYNTPVFSSFVLLGYVYIEVGDSIPAGSITFTWNTTNSGNVAPNTIDLVDVTGGATVLASALSNDGTETITLALPITKTVIGANQFKVQALNSQSGILDRTYDVNWQFRGFYGNSANAGALSEAQIEALSNNPLQAGFAGEYDFLGGDYKYLCFPDVWGTPTSFRDKSTNFTVPMEVVYQVAVTNSFGVLENYNVYRSTNTLGADITIVVA